MADTIRILVTFAEHSDPRLAEQALEGDPSLEVVGYADYFDDWREFLEQPADIVVVACSAGDESSTHMVDRAVKHRPDRPVVVMTESSPNGFLRSAFEAGADDVIPLPQSPVEVAFTLQKVIARRKGLAMPGKAAAPLIAVLGPKGGTGKTLVATNLSVALAQRDANVVLVDLDLQFGDIGLALGLSPERTMYDLMKAGPPFDHEKLDRHLIPHSSGVKVLIAPTRPDQASAVSIDYLRDIYASLRTMCDAVIVDTPPGFTPEVIATIDASAEICMVGMLDSLSLKNTKLGLETLDLMGYDTDRVSLVLNRADSRVGITPDDVSTIVGRSPDVFIPSDREIPRSVNEGTPIVAAKPQSGAAKSFRTLADRYAKTPAPAPSPLPSSSSGGVRRLLTGRKSS
jgi:pilus assembly protein CpaE